MSECEKKDDKLAELRMANTRQVLDISGSRPVS